MANTIPYSSSLVLGHIVNPTLLANLSEISSDQAMIDAAQDNLNSLISTKRSIDMTIQEVLNLGVDISELIKASKDIEKNISKAATQYVNTKIQKEQSINKNKLKMLATKSGSKTKSNLESPLNHEQVDIKSLPYSFDSLKMDCQYFSFAQNMQSMEINQVIKNYIRDQTSKINDEAARDVSHQVVDQIDKQRENHDVEGTLIITATCTHRMMAVLSPFVLDLEKTVRIWNTLYATEPINIKDKNALYKIIQKQSGSSSIDILSGATYGSCFVGMVHVLNKLSTKTNLPIIEQTKQLQDYFKIGRWIANESGHIGVDDKVLSEIRNLLSEREISNHMNVITLGVIPKIGSTKMTSHLKTITDFDNVSGRTRLSKLLSSKENSMKTLDSASDESKAEAKQQSFQNSKIEHMILALNKVDCEDNKSLDINSILNSFGNYVSQITQVNQEDKVAFGVPINFYTTSITKSQIAQLCIQEYYSDSKSSE